ncbi:MAG: hypothetical protein AAFR54_06635 [Planctomycetota bacterium]
MCPADAPGPPPSPAKGRAWERAVERFAADDAPFKARIEGLLAALDEDAADELMLVLKEGRGAWGLLLRARAGDSVLFVGDARSGTPIALAILGLEVTVVDACAVRIAFARGRADALVAGRVRFVRADPGPARSGSRPNAPTALPFVPASFDACVQERRGDERLPLEPADLWRVARSEVFDVRDNRFAYKRSLGRRGAFDKALLGFARSALRAPSGERSLRAARRGVERGPDPRGARADAFALYPHAREFSHVVALDARTPRLTVGPRERRNQLKVLAKRAGLFSVLTPSFGIHGRVRGADARPRIERILEELARVHGHGTPELEVFVATRSNNALLLTSGAARWALHVPTQPSKRRLVAAHHGWLERVSREHPELRVPAPVFVGEIDGVYLSVEERIDGTSATAVTGDDARTAALLTSTARAIEALLDDAETELDEARYAALMDERTRRVLDLAPGAATRRALEDMERRFRERVLGRRIRLATYHADLRGKHVVVDDGGDFRAALDWGASEASFFPLVDLLQLVVHQRKQESGAPFGEAWRSLRSPGGWRASERDALLGYAARAGLSEDDVVGWIDAFPLFVAGMAERNWDFSRPHWIARQFGL